MHKSKSQDLSQIKEQTEQDSSVVNSMYESHNLRIDESALQNNSHVSSMINKPDKKSELLEVQNFSSQLMSVDQKNKLG